MKQFVILLLALSVVSCRTGAQTSHASVQTLICLRHGEKPKAGLGQINCRGLNRALALPKLLVGRYGKPQYIFASNPTQQIDELPPWLQKPDDDKYFYLRPLITIEPTAIACGLPVNIQFGFLEITNLEAELQKPKYENATIFITWEHLLLADFGRNVLKHNGEDPAKIPEWTNDDYDTIYVMQTKTENGKKSFSFALEKEDLKNLGDDCP